MGGPTCEVLLARSLTEQDLQTIDERLARCVSPLSRTRKGRVWSGWVTGRPIDINAWSSEDGDSSAPSEAAGDIVQLSAPCNDSTDYLMLQQISADLAEALGGRATEPTK